MTTFLRWLLLVSIVSLASAVAGYTGFFTTLYEQDPTFISLGIIGTCVLMTLGCGYNTYILDSRLKTCSDDPRYKQYIDTMKRGVGLAVDRYHFMAGAFTTCGMIGTVIGFKDALKSLSLIKVGDAASHTAGLSSLSDGVYTALYTTLVGLVCALILRLQAFNLAQAINRHTDETEVMS